MTRSIRFALSVYLLTFCCFPGLAQLVNLPIRPRPVIIPRSANIRVDVNMALVPVTVMDSYGRSVTGLNPENFRVYESNKEVPIVSFSRQDQPIAVGLIFDCSRSMTDKFKTAREAPRALFEQLNASDESFLVTVSDRAELKQHLTTQLEDVQNALLFSHPNGTTSLLDGIYLGLQTIRKSHNKRRALIVVSDGGDNNSRYSLGELRKIAEEADTQIFAIGLFNNPQTREEVEGPQLLSKLATVSGGVDFEIHNLTELATSMQKIGVTLHNQYVLGYYPPSGPDAGKYRKIKVQLLLPTGLPPLQIFAKSGYYAPGN